MDNAVDHYARRLNRIQYQIVTETANLPRPHIGHPSVEDALFVARESGAKRLILYHHDPDRTDVHMDVLLEKSRKGGGAVEVDAAREGDAFSVGASR